MNVVRSSKSARSTFVRTLPSRLAHLRRAIAATGALVFTMLVITAAGVAQERLELRVGVGPDDGVAKQHHHYRLVVLGTLGGPHSYGSVNGEGFSLIDNSGVVAASADTSSADPNANSPLGCYVPDCFQAHAAEWKDGVTTDLGALPGNNNSAAGSINALGWATGQSQISTLDPVLGFPEFRGVLWKDGQLIDLGTLENGAESLGIYVNDAGQVIGFSTISTESDPVGFFGFPTHTFVWENGSKLDIGTLGGDDAIPSAPCSHPPEGMLAGGSTTDTISNPDTGLPTVAPFLWRHGRMLNLGTLGGTVGMAQCVNKRGQVIGLSSLALNPGACEPALGLGGPAVPGCHAFFWEDGVMTDLGTLGGGASEAIWLNDAGEVVGSADLPGSHLHHAVFWKNGTLHDLGTVSGDPCSRGRGLNARGQVVGGSSDCSNFLHAFLWEDGGPMVDLNTLIPAGSGVQLTNAFNINDHGEILAKAAPIGFTPSDDADLGHLALLIPCDEGHPNVEGCDYSLVDPKAATAAQAVRGTRDSKLSAAGQARGPLSGEASIPAARESTQVRPLLLQSLGFARFTGSVLPVTSGAALTSGPGATLSPASLTFSTQSVGTTSAAETVALKNTGTTSLTISSIAITGTDHADFVQTHTCGSSLAAGVSCSISVAFSPTASGTRTAILSVTDNATGSPQKVSLAGIGTTARLSPSSLNFGAVGIGATSPAQIVTLTNVGTTTLTVTGIAITGTDAADFAQYSGCASPLAAGASCIIRVIFKPAASSTRTAMLSVTDSAAGSPQKVSLAGIGSTARLTPTSLYFASVPLGTTSPAQVVTLTNVGTTTLTVTGIAITGSNAADFTQTHTCASSLAAGASCSISVTFKPIATGVRTAALSVSDNAGGSPQTVSLCGGCIPQGHICYGPGPYRCCNVPFPHHSYCSDPTGWGTCVSS